jgi:hypothetical protein
MAHVGESSILDWRADSCSGGLLGWWTTDRSNQESNRINSINRNSFMINWVERMSSTLALVPAWALSDDDTWASGRWSTKRKMHDMLSDSTRYCLVGVDR